MGDSVVRELYSARMYYTRAIALYATELILRIYYAYAIAREMRQQLVTCQEPILNSSKNMDITDDKKNTKNYHSSHIIDQNTHP